VVGVIDYQAVAAQAVQDGLTAGQRDRITALGVDVDTLTGGTVTVVRQPARAMLHAPQCGIVLEAVVLEEHLAFSGLRDAGLHGSCRGWLHFPGEQRIASAVFTAELAAEVEAITALTEPSPARTHDAVQVLSSDRFTESVTDLFGGTGLREKLLARLREVQQRWAGLTCQVALRPFVVSQIAMPACSGALLTGVPRHVADRVAADTWKVWVRSVAAEDPATVSRRKVQQSAYAAAGVHGTGRLYSIDTSGLAGRWEQALTQACTDAAEDSSVILAVHERPAISGDQAKLCATFPSWRNGDDTAVVRCPAAAALWYHQTGRTSQGLVRWAGDATAADTGTVMETFAALWEPSGRDGLADPRTALDAARAV
jgi:hypothetical protein